MSSSITTAFVKHYQAEVHMAYQRMGSKLRNTVRTQNGVRGSSAVFQVVGNGTAKTRTRNTKLPTMSVSHTAIDIPLHDYYAGDWVDALDELRTNTDEKMITAQAGAYALGRQTDELIIDAMYNGRSRITTINNSAVEGLRATDGLTRKRILMAFEKLGKQEVPDDGQRFVIVGWRQWSELMEIEEFANANYIGEDELPWKGTQAKHWLGSLWMPHSSVKVSGSTRYCFWYHRTAIGHAIGKDITTDITWHGHYASHFVNNMMSQGAGLIDSKGVVLMPCHE